MSITCESPSYPVAQANGIRAWQRDDIERVAEMFASTFPDDEGHALDQLGSYLQAVYLDNPWADDDIPSLVYEQNGVLEGFLGVVPRRMQFRDSPVRVASASSLMVRQDPSGRRNPIAAVKLLSHFLEGRQDLSLTDTANEITRQLWTSCGGTVAYPYCYSWARTLRPLDAILQLSGGICPPLARRIAQPMCRLADGLLTRIPALWPRSPDCGVEDMDTATHLELLATLPRQSLMPSYDEASMEWLITMAEESESEGKLARRAVRGTNGKVLGWFVYYQNQKGIGRVLQLASLPRAMDRVFDSLVMDARQAGLAALWGRTEPDHSDLLTRRHCLFLGRPWVLVHAKNPEMIHCFQNADAFFSGLEGELWIKFNA